MSQSNGQIILAAKAALAVFVIVSLTVSAMGAVTLGPFTFSDEPLPWAEARQACLDDKKHLISIDTAEKDARLFNLLLGNGNGAIANATAIKGQSWTSGKELQEGVWNWDSTGSPFYHTRWFVGQPDDLTDLNCVYVAVRGLSNLYWRDANCSAAMHYICE